MKIRANSMWLALAIGGWALGGCVQLHTLKTQASGAMSPKLKETLAKLDEANPGAGLRSMEPSEDEIRGKLDAIENQAWQNFEARRSASGGMGMPTPVRDAEYSSPPPPPPAPAAAPAPPAEPRTQPVSLTPPPMAMEYPDVSGPEIRMPDPISG